MRKAHKVVNVIKQAVVAGHVSIAENVSLRSGTILQALTALGAVAPRFRGRHGGISIFNDANGWTFLASIEYSP